MIVEPAFTSSTLITLPCTIVVGVIVSNTIGYHNACRCRVDPWREEDVVRSMPIQKVLFNILLEPMHFLKD